MSVRKIEGEYTHGPTQTPLRYVCTYEFKPIGVVHEMHAAEVGSSKWVRISLGVSTWGLWALFPRARLMREVHETIDILDMAKFRAAAIEGD